MSEESFPYHQWVDDALRQVLGKALKRLAETGPIENHHFFINFKTTFEGVEIPKFLLAQYPEEITIVLQHQFEGLTINKSGFEVTLVFSGKKSRLKVPFDAVTSFADPSVNFGLQIGTNNIKHTMSQLATEPKTEIGGLDTADSQNLGDKTGSSSLTPGRPKIKKNNETSGNDSVIEENTENESIESEAETADVIALDNFRKK